MAHFNIEAHLHRRQGRTKNTKTIWIRRYATIQTAMRRCTEFLIDEGQVGDVIEFILIKIPGYQVATIRSTLKSGGRAEAEITWNDSEAKRLKNERMTTNQPVKAFKAPASQSNHVH